MHKLFYASAGWVAFTAAPSWGEAPALMETHCSKCHNDDDMKGDMSLSDLGNGPNEDNFFLWEDSLDFLTLKEMPPPEKSEMSEADRQELIQIVTARVRNFHELDKSPKRIIPRRLNNRELANSVRDVLMIEGIGTHQPMANLLGDTLEDGFDTNGHALGISQFHLEQYIDAFRKVVDATILTGKRPETRHYDVKAPDLKMTSRAQNQRREKTDPTQAYLDFLDTRLQAYFSNFEAAPSTGRYRIKIRATGVDRGIYDADATGIYHDDPIRLSVHLGDVVRTFDLPDNEIKEIELDEWIAEGTRITLSYPTDGLRMIGNGNFKFQNRIAHDYIKQHDPALYQRVVTEEVPKAKNRSDAPSHWVHWTSYWQGPRPRLFSAEIEGPLYETWPPRRQVALVGEAPRVKDAEKLLRPIAERAWRREVGEEELAPIVKLVQSSVSDLGHVQALKEGIVAILVSPSFLLINPVDGGAADRFATKLSYFLKSTTPDATTMQAVREGKLQSFAAVRTEVKRLLDQAELEEFLREFPQAWLQLDRINFMAPDPDHYPLYEKKRLSEDMIAEAVQFFRHMIEHNRPVPEFISADYSFINADLAKIYGVRGVPQDSQLRKYTFEDGRRGGLLGMGSFLTLTADSLGTSPIHRAVYVMENFMGIHPSPPPANVKIEEPDVRQAKTIKEILAAHTVAENCASCHRSIDPFGYAFENFDPQGAWREDYTMQIAPPPPRKELVEIQRQDKLRAQLGQPPLPKPWQNKPIPVDASAKFRNGDEYETIKDFRRLMLSDANRDRFVRCFVTKLLVYANGVEPENYWELEKILAQSAEHDYRIIETIAAVVDSPLFREE